MQIKNKQELIMKKALSLTLILVLSLGLCLTACQEPEPTTYTVTIISKPIEEFTNPTTLQKIRAANYNRTFTKEVADGGIVGTIDIPIPKHLEFGGWFTDASYTYQWNTATDPVKGDMTLYAKWISKN